MKDSNNSEISKKRTQWEVIILACMYIGYMAFMLCRTAIQACSNQMINDSQIGLDVDMYGKILAWGTAGMITGKLLTGMIADKLGGRKVFIGALALTALLAIGFGSGHSFASFAGMNFIMLFAAAAGWPAMASLISAWYPSNKYGRVWGIISTSSRLSSTLSLLFFSLLISGVTFFAVNFPGLSWRNIFRTAGIVGLVIVALIFIFLKARPKDVGLCTPEKEEEPAQTEESPKQEHFLDNTNVPQALWAFAKSGRFWLICFSLMCTTILMEFIGFIPVYLRDSFKVTDGQASSAASVFPMGCLAALVAGGFIYDKVSRKGRIGLLGGLLSITCLCTFILWSLPNLPALANMQFQVAVVTLFFFGMTVAPAYYLPMSIFSIEFGGKHCGLLIGLIDAYGYGASMLYQFTGGGMVKKWGWESMLILLFTIGVIATLATIWFTFEDYRLYHREKQ